MAANPLLISLPVETGGFMYCSAHASYTQRLTIMLGDQPLAVYEGSGENVPMTSNGKRVVSLPTDGMSSELSLTFEYSANGGPFQMATVQTPITNTSGDVTTVTVTSEDTADSDDNDTSFTLVYFSGSN